VVQRISLTVAASTGVLWIASNSVIIVILSVMELAYFNGARNVNGSSAHHPSRSGATVKRRGFVEKS